MTTTDQVVMVSDSDPATFAAKLNEVLSAFAPARLVGVPMLHDGRLAQLVVYTIMVDHDEVAPPAPPPANPDVDLADDEKEPAVKIKLEKWIVNRWKEVPFPLTGKLQGPRKSRHRLTVIEGELRITQVHTAGPHGPEILGIEKGIMTPESEPAIIDYKMDEGWKQVSGNYTKSHFVVTSRELGDIINLYAHVEPVRPS